MSNKNPFAASGQAAPVTENPWHKLNVFTDARVGLGRAGISIPTSHLLAFQLAHAQAQDAVHRPLNSELLSERLCQSVSPELAPVFLHSRAGDRASYLQRPDYGRLLDDDSANILAQYTRDNTSEQQPQVYDLAIAVVDGLSALAVEQNAVPFLAELFQQMAVVQRRGDSWKMAPICIVQQGRVAIGDDICQRLNARCVVVLIGERPGLSSPDSLGLYLTWGAKVGLTDAYRNCISNIRPAGLSYSQAARKALYLLNEARDRQVSGVSLKDRSDETAVIDAKDTGEIPKLLTW